MAGTGRLLGRFNGYDTGAGRVKSGQSPTMLTSTVMRDPLIVEPESNSSGAERPSGDAASGKSLHQRSLVDAEAESRSANFEGWAVLAVGMAFILGLIFQCSPLNGSWRLVYWIRPWRSDMSLLRTGAFLLLPFAAIAGVLFSAESRPGLRIRRHLAILTVSNFLLQLLGIMADPLGKIAHPRGLGFVGEIVLSPTTTSYFTDALRIRRLAGLLPYFDQLMLGLHSSTHPPGPILFFYPFARLFGSPTGATVSGVVTGGLGSLGVLLTYSFASLWTKERRTRLLASALYALLPAMTLYFPELNQVFPIVAMLMIMFWHAALHSQRAVPRETIYLGLTLAVALFFSYTMATVGAFLAYYGLYWLWLRGRTRAAFISVLQKAGVAVGLCVSIYVVLHLATGYHPIAAFHSAQSWQTVYQGLLHRSNAPFYMLYDPYEFLLGSGMLVLPLIAFQLYKWSRHFDLTDNAVALTLIGLATLLTIDLTGAMRGEASRVWLFLQPLVVVPAALELARFRRRWWLTILGMQWVILVCLKAKIYFHVP